MVEKTSSRSPENSLRQEAEYIVSERDQNNPQLPPSESLKLLHEIQVHQVELEIQNEELQQTTRRLEKTQETFYLLFNHAPIGYLVLDRTGMIQRANATFCTMVGRTTDQVIGHPLNQFIVEEDRSLFLSRYRAFYKDPAGKVIEVRMISPQKGKIYARMEGSLVNLSFQNENPETDRELLLTISDITEQKKAEMQNRQNEARLQGMLDIANYQPKDTQDLLNYALEKAIQLTNSQIGYLYFYDEETQVFTLNTWSNEVMEECQIVEKQTVYQLSQTGIWGEAVRQRKALVINDFQAHHPLKKGYPTGHVELTRFMTIPVFSGNKIVAVIGVANKAEDYDEGDLRQLTLLMDSVWKIVERQNAVQSLAESEARYRRLAENAEDLIYRISFVPSQHFEYVSPSSTRITGFTPEEHYADPMLGYKLIHPDDLTILQKAAEGGINPSQPIVLRWVRKDGTVIWTEQKNVPIFDTEGKLIAIEGIARDITERKRSEEILRESEERFRQLAENIHEVFWLRDSKSGEMLYISPKYEEVWERTCHSLYENPKSFIESIHPADRAEVMMGQKLLEEEGAPFDMEYRIMLADDTERWIRARTYPVYNQEGQIIRYAGIAEDITDRKRTEAALRESMIQLQSFFDVAPDLLCIANTDGYFLRLNRAWETTLGYSLHELEGKRYFDYIHPDDIPATQAIAEKLANQQDILNFVNRYRCKDGSYRYIEWRSHPHGKYIYAAARDITHRIQIENELRETKDRFQSIFNSMQEGFALHEIICDENGKPVDYRFLEVNPAFERLTGLRADYLIGKRVREVLPNLENSWIDVYGEVALTGIPKHFEDYSAELGKYYEVNVYCPRPGWFAVIFSDVTERRQYEEEREKLIRILEDKNAELEQFTYTVSHDLKSPLITIKGFLGLLEQDAAEGNLEQIRSDIRRISSAADKMKNLLDDLLELSRIGRIANPPSLFPFQEVVNQAIELLSARIEEKRIRLIVPTGLPAVYGDRARIAEVVQNLLENAIKYIGDQPEPQIEIGFKPYETETHFYVKDNGIGIDPPYLDKVFGLFEKLDTHSEGTGVGLALVKRIIEFHGGKVWVESEGRNKGCIFYFSLPNPKPEQVEQRRLP